VIEQQMNRWLVLALLAICVCGKPLLHRKTALRHEVKPKDSEGSEPHYIPPEMPCSYMLYVDRIKNTSGYLDICNDTVVVDGDNVAVDKFVCEDGYVYYEAIRGDLATTNEGGQLVTPYLYYYHSEEYDDDCEDSNMTESEVLEKFSEMTTYYSKELYYTDMRTETIKGVVYTVYSYSDAEGNLDEIYTDNTGLMKMEHEIEPDRVEGDSEYWWYYTYYCIVNKDLFKYDDLSQVYCLEENNVYLKSLQREVCVNEHPETICHDSSGSTTHPSLLPNPGQPVNGLSKITVNAAVVIAAMALALFSIL